MSYKSNTLTDIEDIDIDNLPIRYESKQTGKVRTVYWLTEEDSERIIYEKRRPKEERYKNLPKGTKLGIMIISDRISAYDINWEGNILSGVPNKGKNLNAISEYIFKELKKSGINNHIVDRLNDQAWLVQKAERIDIEVVIRKRLLGSMWKAYNEDGQREFWGYKLKDNLEEGALLAEALEEGTLPDGLMVTPTTKGKIEGVPGVPEEEDAKITEETILDNYKSFKLKSPEDWYKLRSIAVEAFKKSSEIYEKSGDELEDGKMEGGYFYDENGDLDIGLIDEPPTLDSARLKNKEGKEASKEVYRGFVVDVYGSIEAAKKSRTHMMPNYAFINTAKVYDEATREILGESIEDESNIPLMDCLTELRLIEQQAF